MSVIQLRPVAFFCCCFLLALTAAGQSLTPGFDRAEYRELMLVSTRSTASPAYYKDFPEPARFRMLYQSPVMGLDNLWDLWSAADGATAVISLRGTTQKAESWIANFYAAMVPAQGILRLSPTDTFRYDLAADPHAAVHVGWLVSLAYLSRDILPRIDSLYRSGTKQVLIMGHSQGGAIAYLLTAYLYRLQDAGRLPADIRFKTYCSAGPKPGNLPFAYEYEARTQGGWAYNVVNSADWVPETPMSIQTLYDFNPTNPFVHAKELIRHQKVPARWVMRHVFNRLDKPTRKAQRQYQKYLGRATYRIVRKSLQDLQRPDYYRSNHYVRTGAIVVLKADAAYFARYPQQSDSVFIHHIHAPYLYLLDHMRE